MNGSVTRMGNFWKFLVTNLLTKVAQMYVVFLGSFENIHIHVLIAVITFWAILWLLYISASGHTAQHRQCNIPHIFDHWDYPVVHLLILKSSMNKLFLWTHQARFQCDRRCPALLTFCTLRCKSCIPPSFPLRCSVSESTDPLDLLINGFRSFYIQSI